MKESFEDLCFLYKNASNKKKKINTKTLFAEPNLDRIPLDRFCGRYRGVAFINLVKGKIPYEKHKNRYFVDLKTLGYLQVSLVKELEKETILRRKNMIENFIKNIDDFFKELGNDKR